MTIYEKLVFCIIFITPLSVVFSYDCPENYELWQLCTAAEKIFYGKIISISDTFFTMKITEPISGLSSDEIRLIKSLEPKDTGLIFVPRRYQNYSIGESLLIFARIDFRLDEYRPMGCYLEGELLVYGDSVSFSKIPELHLYRDSVSFSEYRIDETNIYQKHHLDSLIVAIRFIRKYSRMRRFSRRNINTEKLSSLSKGFLEKYKNFIRRRKK